MTIDELIAKLRHDIMVGGGYAGTSADDLEQLIAEINRLRNAMAALPSSSSQAH